MAAIDTTPDVVDITHYAGDTLSITVTAPPALTDGMDWNAEVRPAIESETVDAVFDITPAVTGIGVAYLVLPAAITAGLVAGATTQVQKRLASGRIATVQQYNGVWDCQISSAGSDPVTTLVRGSLVIERDVTRPEVP